MKIFILAFCIFQISLAQVRIVAPPRPIGKFVAQKPVEPPKQAPNEYVSSSRYFKFLSDSLSMIKGTTGDQTVKNFTDTVAEVFTKAKVITDGFQAAGITLKPIAIFENYNVYADVTKDLVELANQRNGGVTPTVSPRISLLADSNVPKVSQQIISQLNVGLRELKPVLKKLASFDELFYNSVFPFGSSIPKFVSDFMEDSLADHIEVINPGSPTTRLRDVAKAIVDSGTPVGVVIQTIIQTGARSVFDSYNDLFTFVRNRQPIIGLGNSAKNN